MSMIVYSCKYQLVEGTHFGVTVCKNGLHKFHWNLVYTNLSNYFYMYMYMYIFCALLIYVAFELFLFTR